MEVLGEAELVQGVEGGRGPIISLLGADLSGAFLNETDLSFADLRDAKGITEEQLEEQAKTLENATMPDGQKYEDWLKSKGRTEGGGNSGPSQNRL